MATSVFAFGETRPGFDVPVLNEREVRAGAGLMFIGAIVAFHHAFLLGEYQLLRSSSSRSSSTSSSASS